MAEQPLQPIPPREGIPSADEMFGNIPEKWIVVWCEGCGASVTVDDDAGNSYAQDWVATYNWAAGNCHGNEVCPALVTDDSDGGYTRGGETGETYDWEDVRIVLGYEGDKAVSRVYVDGELKNVRRVTVENSGGSGGS